MKFIRLTHHARERAVIRYGLDERTLLDLAHKAVTIGYSINDAPSPQIRRWLKCKVRGGKKIYVYGGYTFILSPAMVLITTFRVPTELLMTLPKNISYT